MIQVAIHGAEGRMGKFVTDLVTESDDCELVGLVTESGRDQDAGKFHPALPLIGQNQMADELPSRCVVIDFSLAPALDGLLDQAVILKSPLVMGTTGFSPEQKTALMDFAGRFPVVHAANFSVGIPTLQLLLQLLAKTLPSGFNAEQIETHHTFKVDKPSGTASHLAEVYESARKSHEKIPTHSQRLGGTIGEHTWTFSDSEETLVLTHRAHSRKAFLRGILPSVRFVSDREPGMYGLTHVLQGLAELS